MMTIGSVKGADNSMQAGRSGVNVKTDSVSKNIQNQIANAQKQLQELSSNEDMTLEEKMKKRQEIQKEISNLNQQLRQHQMEQRKEQMSKSASMDDMLGDSGRSGTAKSGNKASGLSQVSMQAMISADSSIKQIQNSAVTKMEGSARVLKAEIKQDAGRDTKAKETELAEVEQKIVNATASQMNVLASANQTIKEAAKAEQDSKVGETDSKTDRKMDKADNSGKKTSEIPETTGGSVSTGTSIHTNTVLPKTTTADVTSTVSQPSTYTSIDIRL